MQQIRIFTNFDVSSLENEINEWLKEHPRIEITGFNSSMVSKGSPAGAVGDVMDRMVVILYKAEG